MDVSMANFQHPLPLAKKNARPGKLFALALRNIPDPPPLGWAKAWNHEFELVTIVVSNGKNTWEIPRPVTVYMLKIFELNLIKG